MPKNRKPSIAVVCGGPSAEKEVSRVSGQGVADALRATYSKVHLLELNKSIGAALKKVKADVVFPVLHGPPGEDGTFQGFLEILGIPYVGSGVQASACAMDKIVSKQIFRTYGLPVARDMVLHRKEKKSISAKYIFDTLGPHVVVKPSRQGSAIGIHFSDNPKALEKAIAQAFSYDERILIEERIRGREITCAILEKEEVEALPVIEIRTPSHSWYDFKHRYTAGLSEHIIPAPLPELQYRRTQEIAKMAHQALGCRDLSRIDFVVPEKGEPILLEVNTMPGMTPTSLYPDAARSTGLSFEKLVVHLVELALRRIS